MYQEFPILPKIKFKISSILCIHHALYLHFQRIPHHTLFFMKQFFKKPLHFSLIMGIIFLILGIVGYYFLGFFSSEPQKETYFSKDKIEVFIATAETYMGVPNVLGGNDYDGIDASGLVYVSLLKNNLKGFPRVSEEMSHCGIKIEDSALLKRGDLLFFAKTYETSKKITTVGIYLGSNQFLHASSKRGVSVNALNDPYYWADKFQFGTRIFN